MRLYLFIICAVFPAAFFAQNLVVNGNFEQFAEDAPDGICKHLNFTQFKEWLPGWSSFEVVTPDLIRVKSADTSCTSVQPHAGEGVVGFYNFHPGMDSGFEHDYHEYMQGQLRTKLQVGTTYYLRIWVQLNNTIGGQYLQEAWPYLLRTAPRACNNIGLYFSEDLAAETENFPKSIRDFNIRPQVNFAEVIKGEGQWVLLESEFVARRPYQYFIIGNFFSDFRTEIYPNENRSENDAFNQEPGPSPKKTRRFSYYLLDDIYIGPDPHTPDLSVALQESGAFVFQNVNFNSGKAILLPEAFQELETLATFLAENESEKVKIGGYTDSIGNADANQQLSEARAKAVYDFLLNKGIAADQLSYRGYGEADPVADNDTPAGRAKNRRVVCVLEE